MQTVAIQRTDAEQRDIPLVGDVDRVRERSVPYDTPDHDRGKRNRDLGQVLHGTTRALRRVEPRAPFHLLVAHVYLALKTLIRLRNLLECSEADSIAREFTEQRHRHAGFSSFGDYAREVLGLAPRTARRRVALSRALGASPTLRRRVIDGRISTGSAVLLAPVLETSDEPIWLEQAEHLSQRDLARSLKDRENSPLQDTTPTAAESDAESLDECGRSTTFSAPVRVAALWDDAMDTAERVLGWSAPRHLCVAALLAESADFIGRLEQAAGIHEVSAVVVGPAPSRESGEPAVSAAPAEPATPAESAQPDPPHGADSAPAQLAATQATCSAVPSPVRRVGVLPALANSVHAHLAQTVSLLDSVAPWVADEVPLHELSRTQRRIRRMEGTLLADLQQLDAAPFLGFRDVTELAGQELGLSRSSVRNRLREDELLQEEESLRVAVEEGAVGIGQAILLARVGAGANLEDHVERATHVTHRQLQREVRLLERLQDLAPRIAARFPGPLPAPGLGECLLATVLQAGWTPAQVRDRLESHGITNLPNTDPAASPSVTRYLELLLDLLALAPGQVPHHLPGPQGQTLAANPGSPAHAQTLAANPGSPTPAQTLAADPRRTRISFWAPSATADQWDRALRAIRAHAGPLPTWAVVVSLINEALPTWTRHDPDTRPTEWAILERDDYWCQAPACSARRNLEAHHIVYRSHSGSDTADNLVTLCHRHHRRGIHEGWARVRGTAPDALTWSLGSTSRGVPIRDYQGQLRCAPGSYDASESESRPASLPVSSS